MRKILKFDQQDVSPRPHPAELKQLMLDVILAWPVLETGLNVWISHATKLRPSETGILLGAMDTRTKIDKLKALYLHRKDKEAVTLLKDMVKQHKEHVEARNTIAHAQLLGMSKSHPREAYFLTSRAVPEEHGFMVIRRVPLADMQAAAGFAKDRAKDIRALLKARGAEFE